MPWGNNPLSKSGLFVWFGAGGGASVTAYVGTSQIKVEGDVGLFTIGLQALVHMPKLNIRLKAKIRNVKKGGFCNRSRLVFFIVPLSQKAEACISSMHANHPWQKASFFQVSTLLMMETYVIPIVDLHAHPARVIW